MTAPARPVRVPAELAVVMLRSSGVTVQPATLRQWVRRGHITRTAEGYDLHEIAAHIEHRNTAPAA